MFLKGVIVNIRKIDIIELHAAQLLELFLDTAAHFERKLEDFFELFFRCLLYTSPGEKTLMWFCRPHGTHCLNENQVFIQGTRDHNTFRFYAEQTYDECIARVIVPKTVKRGKVFGDCLLYTSYGHGQGSGYGFPLHHEGRQACEAARHYASGGN